MDTNAAEDFFKNSSNFLLNVAVDNVIFGYHEKELKVLLQQPFALDKWTVTGGYIQKTESIAEAAARVAHMRTGLTGLFLEQFQSFGNPQRVKDNGFTAKHIAEVTGYDIPENSWIFDYFVSVAFYTLTEFSKVKITKSEFEADCQWWPVSELPPMMFDHELIIKEALKALRLHIAHYPIGYELLEEKFTLPEIHNLYETILAKPLDDRNFTKKLLATGIITKLNEKRQISGHRPPFLYKFNREKYEEGLLTGVELVF
ncbi:NUDIX hydrolase [Mucilaginibacter sp.]|uniref:NUDIX hydrolase n=1 Tax=Mucilaginibacter sp. TaxID=1882438 RepID=UPI002ED22BC9